MNAVIVSFSSRTAGNCSAIAEECGKFYGETARIFRFSDLFPTPCGRCGQECFSPGRSCPHRADGIYALYDALTHSDLAVFVVPNYCDYPCSNFFLFNERSQCYFLPEESREARYEAVRKKFIVVSNTNRENFLPAFRQHVAGEPDCLFLPAKRYGKLSLSGDLMTSEAARADLLAFLAR